jgi:hypothetical protein
MKKLCIAILFVLAATAGAIAETGDGFRDLPWGSRMADLAALELEKIPVPKGATSAVESFRCKNDNLKVGEAVVNTISYNFLNDRLYSVTLDFAGYDNMLRILAYCENRFGKNSGSMVKELERFVSFDSPATGALVYYQFAMHAFFVRYGRLFLYSREMDKQTQAEWRQVDHE